MTSRAERRSAIRALPLLGAVFVAFFLPAAHGCGPEESPLDYVAARPLADGWLIAPSFLLAGVLAMATLLSLRRGEPTRGMRLLALGSVGVLWLTDLVWLAVAVSVGSWAVMVGVAALALIGTVYLLRRARGGDAWAIWERLLAAYALTSAVSYPSMMLSRLVLHRDSLLFGAYVYLMALCGLLVVTLEPVLRRAGGRASVRAAPPRTCPRARTGR